MFRNFYVIALRNLMKNKLFSFINVFGFSLSLSVCLLIISITIDQYSYDQFHPLGEETFRINTIAQRKNGDHEPYASSPAPLASLIRSENSFVRHTVSLNRSLNGPMTNGDIKLMINGYFTESSFFDVFGFTLLKGNADALNDPRSLLISEETEQRFFGTENPIGKTVTIGPYGEFVVRGVIKKMGNKSHLTFDALGSLEFLKTWNGGSITAHEEWKNYYSTYTYVVVTPGTDAAMLQEGLDRIPEKVYRGMTLETRDAGYAFKAQSLQAITPGPMLSNSTSGGMPQAVLIFLMVLAGIGMFAALFNYANLTLARSLTRAREVGIRKVSGATRAQLIFQFMGESVIITLVSFLVAETLLRVFLVPAFQSLSFTSELDIRFDPSAGTYLLFAGFALCIGLLAGIIPAMVLSSFNPAIVIKDISKIRMFSGLTLRKTILISEFVVTIILLIVLTTVYRQSEFASKMEYYGFDWRNKINVQLSATQARVIADEMARFPGVVSYSFASHAMGTWADHTVDVQTDPTKEASVVRDYSVDEHFIETMKISLLTGANLHRSESAGDKVLVNEQFVKSLQLSNNSDAVGKVIYLDKSRPVTIAGVIKDFVFKPVTYAMEPVILTYEPAQWSLAHFKITNGSNKEAISFFESVWKKFNPSIEFSYHVYSDELISVYSIFTDLGRIIGLLSLLILTIAMLGLLGVASYSVETRTREIGIRKVLGASAMQLINLLSKQYLKLIGIAMLIGLPISLFLSNMILESFAYRTEFGIGIILPAVILLGFLVGLTILSQAWRGAHHNPMTALRQE